MNFWSEMKQPLSQSTCNSSDEARKQSRIHPDGCEVGQVCEYLAEQKKKGPFEVLRNQGAHGLGGPTHTQAHLNYYVARAGLQHCKPQPAHLPNKAGLSRAFSLLFHILLYFSISFFFTFFGHIHTQVKYSTAGLGRASGFLTPNPSRAH